MFDISWTHCDHCLFVKHRVWRTLSSASLSDSSLSLSKSSVVVPMSSVWSRDVMHVIAKNFVHWYGNRNKWGEYVFKTFSSSQYSRTVVSIYNITYFFSPALFFRYNLFIIIPFVVIVIIIMLLLPSLNFLSFYQQISSPYPWGTLKYKQWKG